MIDDIIAILRCPLCKAPLARRDNSLVCAQRHCYDIARQGHVNLAPGHREQFYTKQLFESRAAVFAAGLFKPVVDELTAALDRYLPGASSPDGATQRSDAGGDAESVPPGLPVVVDAGCGEGYYVKNVCPDRPLARVGFDLAKDAVRMAARGAGDAAFFVADLANIPLADGCADAVLDVFTPANYAQFGRVLKPGGVLLKLAPRAGYLRELREAAGDRLRRTSYDGGDVERYAHSRMELLETRAITYTKEVAPELALHVARMTPMLAGVDVDVLDLSGVTQITIDETLYIGRVRE